MPSWSFLSEALADTPLGTRTHAKTTNKTTKCLQDFKVCQRKMHLQQFCGTALQTTAARALKKEVAPVARVLLATWQSLRESICPKRPSPGFSLLCSHCMRTCATCAWHFTLCSHGDGASRGCWLPHQWLHWKVYLRENLCAAFRNGTIASQTRQQHCETSRRMSAGRVASPRRNAAVEMHRRRQSVGMEATASESAAPTLIAGSVSPLATTSAVGPSSGPQETQPAGQVPSRTSCAAWQTQRQIAGPMCLHHRWKQSNSTRWTISTLMRNMEMSGGTTLRGMCCWEAARVVKERPKAPSSLRTSPPTQWHCHHILPESFAACSSSCGPCTQK